MHDFDKVIKLQGITKRLGGKIQTLDRKIQSVDKVPDELERRRLKKKYYINQLIAVKFACRAVNELLESTPVTIIDRQTSTYFRHFSGSALLGIGKSMDKAKIKLSQGELCSIFNISRDNWSNSYGESPAKSVLEILNTPGLSLEPMVIMAKNAVSSGAGNYAATQKAREMLTLLGLW